MSTNDKKELEEAGFIFFFKSWGLSFISRKNIQNKWHIMVIVMENFFNKMQ